MVINIKMKTMSAWDTVGSHSLSSLLALSFLSHYLHHSGYSVYPNFNCLCNSKLHPVVSVSEQMGNSLCVVVIIMQSIIFIF